MEHRRTGEPVDTASVLADVAQRLGASLDLTRTLEQVAQSVVEHLGFAIAVLNLVTDEGDLEVAAFAGPAEVRDLLLGQRQSSEAWLDALAASEPWGRLRFLDGRLEESEPSHLYFYVPDIPVGDDPESWHPLDALFAPLYSADGALLGVLSVDLPHDGMRPDPDDCRLLEVFAVQAALAIDHARLYSQLQQSMDEQQRVQHELEHRALHDSLTGLANRGLLLDRLDLALGRSRRDGRGVAVLFLDVDHFKLVNDSLGHAVGDELLVALAHLLCQHLREVDTAGRLGGDEFVLVLEDLSGPAEAIAVVERLLVAVREPLRVGGEQVRTSLSAGIAVAHAGSTAAELLADADTALYRAKAAGRGRWEIFDAEMREDALGQLALRSELAAAAERGEFLLYYQPLVRLATGKRIGYEALLRWSHPTRGLLEPADFLHVLEDSDLDSQVAEWALERACTDAAAWELADFVSVNLSPRQLARPDLARRVADVLARTGLPAGQLWIEITEDRPLDPHQDVADVQRLRDLGVHVALDDFGAGYAGLNYLQMLPADTVKIDRVFVSSVDVNPVSRGIVEAVVGLAEVLDLQVVAEGVETEAQAAALLELGVTTAQGFLFGRPEPCKELPGPLALRRPVLVDDLAGERRRLQSALSVASDPTAIARLSVQAVLRAVRADSAAFVLRGRDDVVRMLHGEGYTKGFVARYREVPLVHDYAVCTTLISGEPLWLERDQMLTHPDAIVRKAAQRTATFACIPIMADGWAHAGLAVSWDRPVELAEVLRAHLLVVVDLIGARLVELTNDP